MNNYLVKDVFTPTKPARITFIDRELINDRLVNALQMPGKQIIVYGHSGSAKTTLLLNKLNQLYEAHITSHCMKGMTFNQIILNAFDQLATYYISERTIASQTAVSTDLAATYLAISSKLKSSETTEHTSKEQRILPPQLTPQFLGRLLGAANCCWIIEDFHKVDNSEKPQLAQLMKVFMDMSDEYDALKIVALGAVDTARQVIEYDPEMRNRVAEIHVDLMSEKEIENIVSKGEEALNISFGEDLKSLIARYSNGLASMCHHICFYMCQAAEINETSDKKLELNKTHFETALNHYVADASDSIRSAFDKALKERRKTKHNHVSLALEALCSFGERGSARTSLLTKIRKKVSNYPENSLKGTLQKLTTDEYGAITRFDQTSGLYSFSDPIYRAFALAHFHKNGHSSGNKNQSNIYDKAAFSEFLEKFAREFARRIQE
ncbi:hypothetical protein [Candidatus Nitrotoga fabula]|nr:hypothetical protein [Candidatus Nitrotoga fabula]